MLPRSLTIRQAAESDAQPLLTIYAPYVESTAVSFETAVPSVDDFTARIAKSLSKWQFLVAERDGAIAGYAYGSTHRERAAYRYSVEVSAYLDPRFHRQGIGSALYRRLFDELIARGYCTAFAGVTLPNDASIGMHQSVGFEMVGVFKRVGWKFDRWHDVAWMQRTLLERPQQG
jgi:L-amino acid N-acyltransferase YncA